MSMTVSAGKPPVPAKPRALRLARGDHEFLPAALEILETPISPVRTSMTLTLCAFVTLAVGWSYVGRIDIIATAQGKIQPVGRTKVVQALEAGRVVAILATDGARVRAGDPLVRLDSGEAMADEGTLRAELLAAKAEVARRTAAIAVASSRRLGDVPTLAFEEGTSASIAERERRVLAGDIGQLASAVGSLDGQTREKAAERVRIMGTINAQQTLVDTLKERVDMRSTLARTQVASRAQVIDALETHQGQSATLASEKGQIGEIDASLARIGKDVDKAYGAFMAENAQKLADAGRIVDGDTQKLAKAAIRTEAMTLRSPIDGVVSGSSVTSIGQVLTSGEQALQVVPTGGALEIEAYLPNGDVAFVKPGQETVLKVESFPFTDYGTIDGKVVAVARDAIPQPEADSREGNPASASRDTLIFGGAQRTQNLVYPIRVEMDRSSVRSEGEDVPLVPGMAVTVEVKTGTRRIISYLLSPVMQVATTAFRER